MFMNSTVNLPNRFSTCRIEMLFQRETGHFYDMNPEFHNTGQTGSMRPFVGVRYQVLDIG